MRKTFRKIIPVILSAVLILGVLPVTAFADDSGTCGSGVNWTLTGGTLAITGSGAMTNYSSSSYAPWDSLTSQITKITVGGNVSRIGDYAFYGCDNLTSVELASGLVTIGGSAFFYCESLTELVLPSTLDNIISSAFTHSGLQKITFNGSHLSAIGNNVFGGTGLKNAKILVPSGFTVGGESAVAGKPASGLFAGNYVGFTNGKATVVWEDYDGTVLRTDADVTAGSIPDYGDLPERAADANYEYVFDAWTPAPAEVSGNEIYIYKATYTQSVSGYTVTWLNWDGEELEKDSGLSVGVTPSYDGETPARESSASTDYTFAGWTDGTNEYGPDDVLPAVTGNVTYTALFSESTRKYTVEWVVLGQTVETDENVEYGAAPSYEGDTPEQESTASTVYTFAGWTDGTNEYGPDDVLPAVTGNVTYTALFSESTRTYTVRWVVRGQTVETDEDVAYGDRARYNGDMPAAYEEDGCKYVFAGWTDGENVWRSDLPEVCSDLTLSAYYNRQKYTSYVDANGEDQSVWATVIDGNEEIQQIDGDNCVIIGEQQLETWYVVENAVYYSGVNDVNVFFFGHVSVILGDGALFDVPGNISGVEDDTGSLTFYGQTAGDGAAYFDRITSPEWRSDALRIFGGKVTANHIVGERFSLIQNAGELTVNSDLNISDTVTFCGGRLTVKGSASTGLITLDPAGFDDSVMFNLFDSLIMIAQDKRMTDGENVYSGMLNSNELRAVQGKTLRLYHDHVYGQPVWSWGEGNVSATATFTCTVEGCGHTESLTDDEPELTEVTPAAVCEVDGTAKYVAKVLLGETEYTDETDVFEIEGSGLPHDYRFDSFVWSKSGNSAQAKLVCFYNPQHVTYEDAEMSQQKVAPTCTEDAKIIYTATYGTYSENNEVTVSGTACHTYGDPVWTWTEEYTATVTFTCVNNDDTVSPDVTVTSDVTLQPTATTAGEKTYTATAEFNGETYTDTRTEVLPATGETDDPGEQDTPGTPSGQNLCKWCGEPHTGFWGKIVGFFHSILYFFAHLFGKR
ncbi:MAG: leucine-rich repeat domain-containing protein [Clostridia bacterium]|nr:leucine-rich repeat domain-containing protein [Clostridia bacterium]